MFWQLIRTDFIHLKQWWSNHWGAKTIIALISLVLVGIFAIGLEQTAYYYFSSLSQSEPYGRVTAEYILHAAFIVSLWFTAVSSFVLASNHVWETNQEWDWLLSQPVHSLPLVLWHQVRMLLPNATLLSLLWIAPSLGFIRVYTPDALVERVVFLSILTVFITFAIQVVTTTLAWSIVPTLRRYRGITTWIGAGAFTLASYLLLTSILPANLGALLRIDIDQFAAAFEQLPLNQPIFFSRYVLDPIYAHISLEFMSVVSGALLVVGLALWWQTKALRAIFSQAVLVEKKQFETPTAFLYTSPLFAKEVLSFVRTKSERNFFIFFITLLAFFYFFLYRSLTLNSELISQLQTLLPFALGTVLFLAIAFFLRLSFPLLAREGKSISHTLTEPVTRASLLRSKVFFSFVLACIFVMVVNLGWWLMPLTAVTKLWLAAFSSVSIFLFAFVHPLIGFWQPDWFGGQHPDQLSTSLQGFFALGFSLAYTLLTVWLWMMYQGIGILALIVIGGVSVLALAGFTGIFAVSRYTVTR